MAHSGAVERHATSRLNGDRSISPASKILDPGATCWRIERADRLALIVNGADYFQHLREALCNARRTVYLIGWDFDLRIEMVPGESDEKGNAPDGLPNRLGAFLQAIVERSSELELFILKWDGAMVMELAQQAVPTLALKRTDRVHFALDSHHPVGATHHQKVVVVDDRLAFCGGIDVTTGRWDTAQHRENDERRRTPDGDIEKPWHDVTTALEGPIARALGDLARERWHKACGEKLDAPEASGSPWPQGLDADLRDLPVAIARTEPAYHEQERVDEIKQLYLAAIRSAREVLYIESQYLASGELCEAMEARLREPEGPEIVVINPQNAEGTLAHVLMDGARAIMIERLHAAARDGATARGGGQGRFAIYYPVNASGGPIYVHAKVVIVDERLVRVGSSNVNNRSMGFDTECDIAFEAATKEQRSVARHFRLRLMSEHLGVEPERVEREWCQRGSLIAAIEALRSGNDGGLVPIEVEPMLPPERAAAEATLFDPDHWQRNRARPFKAISHAAKRTMSPYHVETVGALTLLLGVGAVLGGAMAGRALARGVRERRARAHAAEDGFPAIVTSKGRTRPALPPRVSRVRYDI